MIADLTGHRFGRLVVLSRAPTLRYSRWRCLCDCGNAVIVSRQLLSMGARGTRSCGCLRTEQRRAALLRMWAVRRTAPRSQDGGATLARVWQ